MPAPLRHPPINTTNPLPQTRLAAYFHPWPPGANLGVRLRVIILPQQVCAGTLRPRWLQPVVNPSRFRPYISILLDDPKSKTSSPFWWRLSTILRKHPSPGCDCGADDPTGIPGRRNRSPHSSAFSTRRFSHRSTPGLQESRFENPRFLDNPPANCNRVMGNHLWGEEMESILRNRVLLMERGTYR